MAYTTLLVNIKLNLKLNDRLTCILLALRKSFHTFLVVYLVPMFTSYFFKL